MPKVSKSGSTPLEKFNLRWAGGCGSTLCSQPGVKVLLCRGTVPCDILFVGEAPGESENVIGRPFVGPAGKLLDSMIARALEQWQTPGTEGPTWNSLTWAFTNLVCCIPRDPKTGGKASEPLPEEIRQCGQRLADFLSLASPSLVVCVGTLAREWVDGVKKNYTPTLAPTSARPYMLVSIDHPAYLLRLNQAMRALAIQRAIITIQGAVEEMMGKRVD